MMHTETSPIDLAAEIHRRLLAHYGKPVWRIPLSPLDELISTILSQNTNDQNRDRAFQGLKNRFSTWEDVRKAETQDVVDAIRPAGLANQKGPRIQKVLNEIHAERGDLDLSFLKVLPRDEVRRWLLNFNGVGPKTAAIVLQFSLDKPAFPVDTHIYRVTGRLGITAGEDGRGRCACIPGSSFPSGCLLCGSFEFDQAGTGDLSSQKTGMPALPPA